MISRALTQGAGVSKTKVNSLIRDSKYTEKDFLAWLKSMTRGNKIMMRNKGDGIYYISQQIDSKTAWEVSFIYDPDGFFRVYGFYILTLGVGVEDWTSNPTIDYAGTYTTNSSGYKYTTTKGSTFSAIVKGPNICLKSVKAVNGGMWRFTIDGGNPIDVSCWNATSVIPAYLTIATGLTDTYHTVVGTFIGDDPAHVPSGGAGTGRGYFYYKEFINDTFYASSGGTALNLPVSVASSVVTSSIVSHVTSKIEFAINCRPSVMSGWAVSWVPDHTGSANGAMADITSIPTINNIAAPALADIATGMFIEIVDFMVQTKYTAYNTADDSKTYPLWDGELFLLINKEGFIGNHKLMFRTSTYVDNGFAAMIAPTPSFAQIKTNASETYNALVASGDHKLSIATQVFSTDGSSCACVAWTSPNIFKFFRLDESVYSDKLYISDSIYYHKTYPKVFDNETIDVGYEYEYAWEWAVGRYPDDFTTTM